MNNETRRKALLDALLLPEPMTPAPMEVGSFMPRKMNVQPSTQGWMGGILNAREASMPAPSAVNAGPAPMPPQRPAPAPQQQPQGPVPYPPQRPGPEMGPGGFAGVQGYNPMAFAGNAQQYADQFSGGDLSKLAARTYRNDDGTMWNDYYLQNPGAN